MIIPFETNPYENVILPYNSQNWHWVWEIHTVQQVCHGKISQWLIVIGYGKSIQCDGFAMVKYHNG